jgi:hypothetical protein
MLPAPRLLRGAPGYDGGHSYGYVEDDVEIPVRLPFVGPLKCPPCRTSEEALGSHHRGDHSDARSKWVSCGCHTPFVTYRAVENEK